VEKGMMEELLEQHMPLLLWHATRMGKPHLLPDGEAMSVCYEVFMKCALLYKSNDELDDIEDSIAFGKYLGTALYYELEAARVAAKCRIIDVPANVLKAVNALKGGYTIAATDGMWKSAEIALQIEVCSEEALTTDEAVATHDSYKEATSLHKCIKELPLLQRKLIQLSLQDCDKAETAEVLGVDKRCLYYQHEQAIKRLRKLMGVME